MVMSSSLAGAEMRTFLAPPHDVLLGVGLLREDARGLDHDVDAELAPRNVGGVALGQHLDGVAVDRDGVLGVRHLGLEAAQDGVVLQKVCGGRGVTQVVDSNDLDVCTLVKKGAEIIATDAAKAVDAYADRHEPISSLVRRSIDAGEIYLGCPRPPPTLPPISARGDIERLHAGHSDPYS